MLMTREDFIDVLKSGKRMLSGKRVEYLAGTFEVSAQVELKGSNGQEFLYISKEADNRDNLEGVPQF